MGFFGDWALRAPGGELIPLVAVGGMDAQRGTIEWQTRGRTAPGSL